MTVILVLVALFAFYLFVVNAGGPPPLNSNLPPRWRNG